MTDPKCIRCRGSLLPEWGAYKHCPTCREQQAAAAKKYRSTKKGKATSNAARRASYQRNTERENTRHSARRLAKKLEGICTSCSAPAADDSNMCESHRDKHRASALAHYHRSKTAGAAC